MTPIEESHIDKWIELNPERTSRIRYMIEDVIGKSQAGDNEKDSLIEAFVRYKIRKLIEHNL